MQSIPDMDGVVSDELRYRIERVLAFPVSRGDGEGQAGESSSTNGHVGDTR